MKKLIFLFLFLLVIGHFVYAQDPQEFFAPIQLNVIPNLAVPDSVATFNNKVINYTPKSAFDQQLTLSGTEITIDGVGGNTLDIGGIISGGVWGTITGTIASQTDLQAALDAKQATLISATNIRTINGNDLLGSGNLVINTGGTITSVNADVGPAVVLDPDDFDDSATTNKFVLAGDITNWNNAFGWGNHGIVGYSTGAHTTDTNTQLSNAQVSAAMIAINPLVDLDSSDDLSSVGFSILTGAARDNTDLTAELDLKANDNVVMKEHAESPTSNVTFAVGSTTLLDAMTTPADLEFANDGVTATDGFVTDIGVTGVATKTITLTMNGMPDVTTTFTDDGAGGAGDGNDYLQGVTETSDILTFDVLNQTNPTFDIGTYLGNAGYTTTPHTVDTNLNEAQVDGFVANNGYSVGAHTTDTNTQLNESQVDAFVANNGYSTGAHTTDTNLSGEEVSDLVGAMVTGNTETNITVTYSDADNTLDFVATDTNTQLSEATVDSYANNNGYSTGAHTTDTNTQLSQENVQDFIAPMLTGNTETNINVTYDDVGNEIDFEVISDENNTANTIVRRSGDGNIFVQDETYNVGWNNSLEVPTKDAIYDYLESLNIQQYAEGYATTGLVLRGATSGTYTISNQQIRWARYGQLVTFTITMENINGATPLGDMILEVDGVSGFPTPYIFKSFIFNVTSNGFGRDGIHHFVWNDTNYDWKFYSEALATDDDNINSPVVNANFTGVEDITISGSFLSNSVFP